MPKRIVDGEGLWRSDKLSQVEPHNFRSEYANLLPLAMANGSFEANPRRIWSTVYCYNRPDVTVTLVEQILAEFERVKLLFRWIDGATGKEWGYWIGIEKPGRLPTPSRLRERHERLGLQPPAEKLAQFLGSPMGTQPQTVGQPASSLGSGSSFGSGGIGPNVIGASLGSLGQTTGQPTNEALADLNPLNYARQLCAEIGMPADNSNLAAVAESISAHAKSTHCAVPVAMKFLIDQAKIDEERAEVVVDKFYFTDRKWLRRLNAEKQAAATAKTRGDGLKQWRENLEADPKYATHDKR